MAGDRVGSGDSGVDGTGRDDVGGVEQFRRFEELARVDQALPRLVQVARLAGALAPTQR